MMRTLNLLVLAASSIALLAPQPVIADPVIHWNAVASDVLVSDELYQNPGMSSRTLAMVNLAIYDSVMGITGTHVPFYSHAPGPVGASLEAATVQAAYRVLTSIYPSQQPMLDLARSNSLLGITDGPGKQAGLDYGDTVATSIVNLRMADGFDAMTSYVPNGGPGRWEPDPLNPTQEAWGPQWGQMSTFGIGNTAPFLPPPMPSLTSQEYADAFNEVKELGSKTSVTRTVDQTELALFWAYDRLGMGTPMRLYNSVLRTVATDQGNDLVENARLFALASTAMADTGIVAWDTKFIHDLWRPISGIRRADEDGNPDTIADPAWEPLGAPGGVAPGGQVISDFTPSFPTYVSGHASFGGALFESLKYFYGTDDVTFSLTSDEVPGATRMFNRFSDAMHENGRSRVYLGIHWNFDDTVGQQLGQEIADHLATTSFQPVPEPSAAVLAFLAGCGAISYARRIHPRGA